MIPYWNSQRLQFTLHKQDFIDSSSSYNNRQVDYAQPCQSGPSRVCHSHPQLQNEAYYQSEHSAEHFNRYFDPQRGLASATVNYIRDNCWLISYIGPEDIDQEVENHFRKSLYGKFRSSNSIPGKFISQIDCNQGKTKGEMDMKTDRYGDKSDAFTGSCTAQYYSPYPFYWYPSHENDYHSWNLLEHPQAMTRKCLSKNNFTNRPSDFI